MNNVLTKSKPTELLKVVATAASGPQRVTSGSITSIDRTSGTTKCTVVTAAAHGLTSGARVHIIGAVEPEFDPDTQVTFASVTDVSAGDDEITLRSGVPFKDGTQVFFTSAATLPTGITAGTLYWAKKVGTNLISLYTDEAMGSIVNITAAGSGSHVLHVIEDGVGITVLSDTSFSYNCSGSTASATGTITYYADVPFRRAVLQARNDYQTANTGTVHFGVRSATGEQSTTMATGAATMFEKTELTQNLADFWLEVETDGDGILIGYQ